MEYFDVVNEEGLPTGERVSRAQAHKNGIMHRTAHVWVIREGKDGTEVLMQKRSDNSESFPGMFDTSSSGHIPAGCEPTESALRELSEELGLTASEDQLHFIGTFRNKYEELFHGSVFHDNEISWVYVYKDPIDIDKLTLQEEEVSSVKWFALTEVWEKTCLKDKTFCVTMKSLELLGNYCSYKKD